MKQFGEGSDRIIVKDDGSVVNSVGHIYNPLNDHDEALAEAYDLDREGFFKIAKNIRDAVHYARRYVATSETTKLDKNKINDLVDEEWDSLDARSKYERWVKHLDETSTKHDYDDSSYW
jgi:hypothetical protein